MKTEIKTITPKMALTLLTNNQSNRPLRVKTVNFYADQMKRGAWKLTPEGISFFENGSLANGQHRLNAVVKSGVNIKFLMIYGVSKSVFDVIDTGKNRSAADVLGLQGVANTARISGGISKYLGLKKNLSATKNKESFITNTIISDTYFENKERIEKLLILASKIYQKLKIFKIAEIIGFSLYYQDSGFEIIDFFNEAVGINISENKVPILLRDKLINAELSGRPITGKVRSNTFSYAIKHYIKGSNLKILKLQINYK